VGEVDSVNDRFFFYFFGAGLDHHDAVGAAYDHDVEQAVAHLAVGGIDYELTVN